MKIGSLFSGAGGLDLAVLELFEGSSIAWHAEINQAASKALAFHWPDIPNLGDVSMVDWSQVEQVDVVVGGFPCQDVSLGGRRAGLSSQTRSGLWAHMAAAIAILRPRYVLIENVRGLLSAKAVRGVESEPGIVGDGGGRPALRALGAVLGDLAGCGFDAEWTCLPASQVGACHRRERVFVLAHSAYTDPVRSLGDESARRSDPSAGHREREIALLPTPQVADVTGGHRTRSGSRSNELLLPGLAEAYTAGALLPSPRATDGTKGGPNQRGSHGDLMLPSAVVQLLPTPIASDSNTGQYPRAGSHHPGLNDLAAGLLPTPTASDASGGGQHPDRRAGHSRQLTDYALIHPSPRWGKYEAAIRRQELASRPAPSPTEPNTKGHPRLSARFAEWMMFWPAGWVTDPAIGISRADQLRIIGNGVVVPQALWAFGHLLGRSEVTA